MSKMETKLYLFSLSLFRKMFGACSKRQLEWFAGETVVRTVFSQLLGCSWDAVEINRENKPFVKNTSLEYNLSHCENWLLFAVGEVPLGVDIETFSGIREKTLQTYIPATKNNW